MKNRAVIGGIAVGAVVLATFLTGNIPGFGSGSQSGTGEPSDQAGETGAPPAAQPGEAGTQAEETASAAQDAAAPSDPASPPPELIQVVVERDIYGLQQADGRYRVVPITEVLEAARRTTGNEDGIKVRILRKSSAKVVAWSTLEKELQDSGIAPSAILIPKKLVD